MVPKVSVCVVTYNQEKYIGQCLQSIVDQETDFPYEIIVADDCSKDGTADIIMDFHRKFPGKIRPFFHERNLGAAENVFFTYKKARGQYISHLDGDDFALPGKLQKQADVLDAHSDCIICSHDVVQIVGNKRWGRRSFGKAGLAIKNLKDLYKRLPFFAHSSKMFRNDFPPAYWDQFDDATVDFEIHIEQARGGNIAHICEFLGEYTTGAGISLSNHKVNPLLPAAKRRVFLAALKGGCVDLSTKELETLFARDMLSYAYVSARVGDISGCQSYAIESIKIKLFSPLQFLIFVMSHFPRSCRFTARIYYRFRSVCALDA